MSAPAPTIDPRSQDTRRVRQHAHVRLVLGVAQLVGAGLTIALLLTRGSDGPSISAAVGTARLAVASRLVTHACVDPRAGTRRRH